MKELSIEQKARRYDEIIEKAKSLLGCNQLGDAWIYKLLPELSESEDERIRKELIDFVKSRLAGFPQCEKFLAWLEKQEDKTADNIEMPWNEEDEKKMESIIGSIRFNSFVNNSLAPIYEGDIRWLKFLKDRLQPQSQWKPSDVQMASITCAVRKMKESACYDSELVSLLSDLKKLREE